MSNIRITEQRIKHLMGTAEYEVFTSHNKCTIVSAKLENGFVITESAACVDPDNYDRAQGVKYATRKIELKLWELEGYALQDSIHRVTSERK